MAKENYEGLELRENNKISVDCIGRTIYFFDEIDNDSAMEFLKLMDTLERTAAKKDITIILHTPGGDVYSGLLIYDRIRSCACDITTIASGFVASMGFVVYLAGDKRVATKNARFLNHQGHTMIEGKETDIEIEHKELKTLEGICNTLIAERTGQDIKKWEKQTKMGNKYINAPEAKKLGVVHEIVSDLK